MRIILLALFVFSYSVAAQSGFVFVSPHDKHYHNADCKEIVGSITRLEIKDAVDKGYTPCLVCFPTPLRTNSNTTTKKQCKAITLKGTQCSRNAEDGSDYCWQHKKTNTSTDKKTNYDAPSGRTIYTGPRGGQYYINKNGNKTYIKRK